MIKFQKKSENSLVRTKRKGKVKIYLKDKKDKRTRYF